MSQFDPHLTKYHSVRGALSAEKADALSQEFIHYVFAVSQEFGEFVLGRALAAVHTGRHAWELEENVEQQSESIDAASQPASEDEQSSDAATLARGSDRPAEDAHAGDSASIDAANVGHDAPSEPVADPQAADAGDASVDAPTGSSAESDKHSE